MYTVQFEYLLVVRFFFGKAVSRKSFNCVGIHIGIRILFQWNDKIASEILRVLVYECGFLNY